MRMWRSEARRAGEVENDVDHDLLCLVLDVLTAITDTIGKGHAAAQAAISFFRPAFTALAHSRMRSRPHSALRTLRGGRPEAASGAAAGHPRFNPVVVGYSPSSE